MITVAQKTEEIITKSSYLREAISEGLINLSALARKIQPQIQEELMKDVKEGAIFAALYRMQDRLQETDGSHFSVNPVEFLENLTLKSGLFDMTVANSKTLTKNIALVAEEADKVRSSLFISTKGQDETTIITEKAFLNDLNSALDGEEIIKTIPNLSCITFDRSPGAVKRTGVLYFPMKILAWEKISVVEVITTINKMLLIIKDEDVDRAFIALRKAVVGGNKTIREKEA